MDKQVVKNIIVEKQEEVPAYQLVHRDMQFGSNTNYVLVGLRRAGKSYMLYQDAQSRIAAGEMSAQDMLYVNFEDERLSYIKVEELGILLDAYMELYPGRKPRVYLDEIQNVDGWEKFARRLADSHYRVMITGSNAKMLSREIASTLGGRYIPREVFPFTFREYLDYHHVQVGTNWEYSLERRSQVARCFDNYFREGGIAETFAQVDKREYLTSLYQKILVGDIVERNKIRNPRVFRFLARKLADSVMQPTSLARLQHVVKSSGDSISLPGLKDYLGYMQDAYLFFPVPNLASAMSEQSTLAKRYMADNGILNLFLSQGETKLLENMVAVDLNRRYRSTEDAPMLYYYSKGVEVDFCVPAARMAIQVSYSMEEAATRERELGALAKFLKANPEFDGWVITRDHEEEVDLNGKRVHILPVWKWLLR